MMFCGDTDQIDLQKYGSTGLKFLQSVDSIDRMHTINLLENHRHPILESVLKVYENYKYLKGL